MTNRQIINCFINGIYAKNNNLLSSEGVLYSYDMPIATLRNNKGIINDFSIDYIERMTGFRSVTTRQHIGLLKRIIGDNILDWKVKSYE